MKTEAEIRERIAEVEASLGNFPTVDPMMEIAGVYRARLDTLYWTLGLCRVNRASFSAWENPDGGNAMWDKFTKIYPLISEGVVVVPLTVRFENVTFDFDTGSVYCCKPTREGETANIILHVREK